MTNSGLTQQDIDIIISVISEFPEVEQALIFGSRAIGSYRNGSDVDIALKGKELDMSIISHVSYRLNEETSLPYLFDVLNYHTITSSELTEHIDRVGVSIYEKKNTIQQFKNKI